MMENTVSSTAAVNDKAMVTPRNDKTKQRYFSSFSNFLMEHLHKLSTLSSSWREPTVTGRLLEQATIILKVELWVCGNISR